MSRLSMYAQAYTLYSSVRPFGCSTILGGIDENGPGLYVIEPSGVAYVRFHVPYQILVVIAYCSFLGLPRRGRWQRASACEDRTRET